MTKFRMILPLGLMCIWFSGVFGSEPKTIEQDDHSNETIWDKQTINGQTRIVLFTGNSQDPNIANFLNDVKKIHDTFS